MRALVTGTMTPVGLFLVRYLHEMGFEVTAGGCGLLDYILFSKGVKRRLRFPSPRLTPGRFIQAVLDELKRGRYDLYLPSFEDGYLMSYYQDQIRQLTRFQMMPYPSLMAVHDKANMANIAKTVGIPIPSPTFRPTSLEALAEAVAAVDYPVVVKLRKSCNANGQQVVKNARDLPAICADLVARYHLPESELPIIQRYIKGSLISTVNLAKDGQVLGQVVFEALRVYPREGGTSSLRQVIRHERAESLDRALVAHLGWTGFLSVDYMRDGETGDLFLIDVNPRLAPGVIFGYHAGTDLLGAYIDLLFDRPVRSISPPREGVLAKMHFPEVGAVLQSLFDRDLRLQDKIELWRSVLSAVPYPDDIFSWRDLKPFFALWAYILPNVPRLLSREGGEIFLRNALFDQVRFEQDLYEMEAAASLQLEGME